MILHPILIIVFHYIEQVYGERPLNRKVVLICNPYTDGVIMIVRLIIKHGGRSNTGIFINYEKWVIARSIAISKTERQCGVGVRIMGDQLPNPRTNGLVFQNRGTI